MMAIQDSGHAALDRSARKEDQTPEMRHRDHQQHAADRHFTTEG